MNVIFKYKELLKLFSKLGVPLNIDCSKSGYKSSPLSSDLIFWGCHVMKQRYKKAFIPK